jgi:hypothetical protein
METSDKEPAFDCASQGNEAPPIYASERAVFVPTSRTGKHLSKDGYLYEYHKTQNDAIRYRCIERRVISCSASAKLSRDGQLLFITPSLVSYFICLLITSISRVITVTHRTMKILSDERSVPTPKIQSKHRPPFLREPYIHRQFSRLALPQLLQQHPSKT